MLLVHISIALSSLVLTTILVFSPSKAKLHASYALTAATLITGTYLVVSSGSHMLQACTTGLLYLGLTSLGIVAARRKLAAEQNRDE